MVSRNPSEALVRLETAAAEHRRAQVSEQMSELFAYDNEAVRNIARITTAVTLNELEEAREDLRRFIIVTGA